VVKANGSSYTTQYGLCRSSGSKRKENQGRKNGHSEPALEKVNSTKRKRGKRGGKKGKISTTCFNCDKKGHFACDYTESKKVPLT